MYAQLLRGWASYIRGVVSGWTAFCPLFDSARYMAELSIMFASQGLLVVIQKLPMSGYSPSTATPTSVSGRVHMSPGMPQLTA